MEARKRAEERDFKLTAAERARRDFKFCDQINNASGSASANIAEGFWRYGHKEFAQFLRIARSSLGETQSHLRDGLDRGYVETPDLSSRKP